jgi:hypothetical protein
LPVSIDGLMDSSQMFTGYGIPWQKCHLYSIFCGQHLKKTNQDKKPGKEVAHG